MDTINASMTVTGLNEQSIGTENQKRTLDLVVRLGEQVLLISTGALTIAACLM